MEVLCSSLIPLNAVQIKQLIITMGEGEGWVVAWALDGPLVNFIAPFISLPLLPSCFSQLKFYGGDSEEGHQKC